MHGWWIAAGAGAAILSGLPASAQDPAPASPALVAADLRPGLSLSGSWHYSIDPYR